MVDVKDMFRVYGITITDYILKVTVPIMKYEEARDKDLSARYPFYESRNQLRRDGGEDTEVA